MTTKATSSDNDDNNPTASKTSPQSAPTKSSPNSSKKPTFFTNLFKPPAPKFSFRLLAIGVLMTCWVGISVIIGQIVVYYIFTSFITSAAELELPLYSAIYSAASYIAAALLIALVPWLIFRKWRPTREELGLSGAPTWLDIGLAIVAIIAYFILAAAITAIFFYVLFPGLQSQIDQAQDVGFDNLTTTTDLLIGFVTLVIVAPIAEEFIFRGWLYGKLRTRLPLPLAILLVSLLFAFLHGQWNVAVNVFAMSIVLCLQREITGTIYSGILLHILKNALAFYLLYIAV